MNTGKTRGYVLTFRCIKCGKYEVFAHYTTERIVFQDQIRGRLYQVSCESYTSEVLVRTAQVKELRRTISRAPTAALRIPPWLASGWGCRSRRLSRV